MAMVATDLKQLLSVKIKSRDDTVYDQYNRIFMMKLLLVCSVVTGISWYGDSVNCIVPEEIQQSEDFPKFVGTTCWIQGLYIYRELRMRQDEVAYYGIPKDMDKDGLLENKELCSTYSRLKSKKNIACKAMTKTFFQQYQYMPFLLAAFGLLYFLPYMLHKVVNNDIIHLQKILKKDEDEKKDEDKEADIKNIIKFYFKNKRIGRKRPVVIPARQLMILIIKLSYIIVNCVAFYGLDNLLDGEFVNMAPKWWKWARETNSMQYDYMGTREYPKPANEVLPPFGYCELYSSSKDIRQSHANKYKVVCEMSQHILYQYCLVLLWIFFVIGIIVSVIGLLIAILKIITGIMGVRTLLKSPKTRKIYERLTLRQIDYLEFIKEQNLGTYGEVMENLVKSIDDDMISHPDGHMQFEKKPIYTGGSVKRNPSTGERI